MGNRIHTVIGYGFTDVNFNGDDIFSDGILNENDEFYDKNFLPEMDEINRIEFQRIGNKNYDHPEYFDVAKFRARMESRGWYENETPPESIRWIDIAKYSGYASEMATAPIVFVDPFAKDWHRFDDLIDHYIFSNNEGPIEKVKPFVNELGTPYGIYPHSKYVNELTGSVIKGYVPLEKRWNPTEDLMKKYSLSKEEVENHIVPEIPYEIRLFCQAAKVFKNLLTVYELRAMLYTYWC